MHTIEPVSYVSKSQTNDANIISLYLQRIRGVIKSFQCGAKGFLSPWDSIDFAIRSVDGRLDASPDCCQFSAQRDSLGYPGLYKVLVDFLFAQLPVVHSDETNRAV